jgi:hypothetical protein
MNDGRTTDRASALEVRLQHCKYSTVVYYSYTLLSVYVRIVACGSVVDTILTNCLLTFCRPLRELSVRLRTKQEDSPNPNKHSSNEGSASGRCNAAVRAGVCSLLLLILCNVALQYTRVPRSACRITNHLSSPPGGGSCSSANRYLLYWGST